MESNGKLLSRNSLSMKQKRFLAEFRKCISVKEACKTIGIKQQLVTAWLSRPNTLFTSIFKKMSNEVQNDERFSKAAGLERFYRYLHMAEEAGDYMGATKIQGEINKMIEGNIAIQKSVEKKETEVTVRVLDFTQRLNLPQKEDNIIDITPTEFIDEE